MNYDNSLLVLCKFTPKPNTVEALFYDGDFRKLERTIKLTEAKALRNIVDIRKDKGHPTRVIIQTTSYEVVIYPNYWIYWEENSGALHSCPTSMFHERYDRKL